MVLFSQAYFRKWLYFFFFRLGVFCYSHFGENSWINLRGKTHLKRWLKGLVFRQIGHLVMSSGHS